MKLRHLLRGALLALLFSALFLTTACTAVSTEHIWLKAPGWNRAAAVATTYTGDPVPIITDDSGQIYLLLIDESEGVPRPVVVALNRQAQTAWRETIDMALRRPDKQRLHWLHGRLHAFWLSDQALYTAVYDATGTQLQGPTRLTGEEAVNDYAVVAREDGSLSIWYAGPRNDPGLYVLETAVPESEPILVDPEGILPTARRDEQGNLHVLWARSPGGYEDTLLLYASYPDSAYVPERETIIQRLRLGITTVLEGPWMGMDSADIYAFWTEAVRTGMEAGRVDTYYISFPPGEPTAEMRPVSLVGTATADLDYEPFPSGVFQVGPRIVDANVSFPPEGNVRDIVTLDTAVSELGIAYSNPVQHEYRKFVRQIHTTFLADGAPTSRQVLSFTTVPSDAPAIHSDADRFLYITWLEIADPGFSVYFSSTAPDVQESLSRVTFNDVLGLAGATVFGLLSGAVLSPFLVFLWSLGPLLMLGLTSPLRRESDDGVGTGTIISLVLTFLAYSATKFFTLPGFRSYVPFSAWLPFIPPWMQAPLQILVPLSITLFAIAVAWHYVYRRGSRSVLYFYLVFAAIDALLTTAVYGFLIYNTI